MLLAIETSCDETAVAILDLHGLDAPEKPLSDFLCAEIVSSQVETHRPYGGIVPELAAREHVVNLPLLVNKALEDAGVSVNEITAVAVTRGPGLKVCLLVGMSFAKALAFSRGIPLLALNHIEGHLLACDLLEAKHRPRYPALSLVVSGGHTLLLLAEKFQSYQILASTRDDAAGEAFDKLSTLLGLPYPGGPALSELAREGDNKRFKFPIAIPADLTSFSFSGLKTAVMREVEKLGNEIEKSTVRASLAASIEEAIVTALVTKTLSVCKQVKPRSLVLTGGVAANTRLRDELGHGASKLKVSFHVPPVRWCTDNAAMMAALGARVIEASRESYQTWTPGEAGGDEALLGPGTPASVGPLARWGVDEVVTA